MSDELTQAHSSLGASSMYRWSACPGSVALSAGIKSVSSAYAEEGTNAHTLGSVCLTKKHKAAAYVGKKMKADNGGEFTVTREMADAVQVYLNEVRSYNSDGAQLVVEQKFDLSAIHAGCFGTADAVVWEPSLKTLTVVDYKHGAGIPVTVTDNPQLQYYALGALLASGHPAEKVRMVIVQPRCDHADGPVREWIVDAVDLIDFSIDLDTYAKATEARDAALNPGSHCRFCPAAQINPKTMDAYCPAHTQQRQEVARMEFSPVLSYDPGMLRKALDSRDVIKSWLKNLDEFAYREAEAGRCPPGYKLVPKRATRKWADEGAVVDTLQNTFGDALMAEMYEPVSLRTPAQLEAQIASMSDFQPEIKAKGKRKDAAKEFLAEFVIAESSGHNLAPESDSRAPVSIGAKADFTPVTGAPEDRPGKADISVFD
jgi:hypothetical protein